MDSTLKRALMYRWFIFAVLAAQYLFVYFHRVCPAVVASELIKSFNISGTALGILASGYFYPYAAMQIPVGIIVDAWGTRKTVTLFALIAALGSIFFSLSPTFGFATFSRIFVGLGVSAMFVASLKVFANWFKGIEFARMSSLLMAIGGVGGLVASTPLALLTEQFGWRGAFLVIGIITILLTVVTWFTVVDRPEDRGFPAIIEADKAQAKGSRSIGRDMIMVLREKHFWPIAFWFFFTGTSIFGFFGLWAGPYLMDTYSLSKPAAGNILSMIYLSMILGGPFLGHLSDKILVSRKKVLIGSAIAHALCWLIMLLYYNSLPIPVLYIIFFFMGTTGSGVAPVGYAATKELFPTDMAGTSIGTVNLFPFLGGAIFQPLIGYILDRVGKVGAVYSPSAYKMVILVLFIISLSGLACLFLSKETIRK